MQVQVGHTSDHVPADSCTCANGHSQNLHSLFCDWQLAVALPYNCTKLHNPRQPCDLVHPSITFWPQCGSRSRTFSHGQGVSTLAVPWDAEDQAIEVPQSWFNVIRGLRQCPQSFHPPGREWGDAQSDQPLRHRRFNQFFQGKKSRCGKRKDMI